MYIILAYSSYVLLVVITSALVFGFCVAVLIVQELIKIVFKWLSGTIQAGRKNLGLKPILPAFSGRSGKGASESCADGARS